MNIWGKNMKKIVILLVLMLVFIILLMPSISASTKTVELIPIEDSAISYSMPDFNFGSVIGLYVEGIYCIESWCFGYKSYLKFDLSEIPSAATVTSAELKLYKPSTSSGNSAVSVFYCSNNNWNELVINWNNAPSFESTPIDTHYSVAFEGWYSWTVTKAVNKALSVGTLTLVLDEQGQNALSGFYSKDNLDQEKKPKLIISYTQSNDPPSADFSYTPSNPTTVDVLKFTDLSTDTDGSIVSWLWSFGDGTTSTNRNPTHKYDESGAYLITLTVTDDDGVTDKISAAIYIEKSPSGDIAGASEDNGIPGFEAISMIVALVAIAVLLLIRRRKIT
jgi:hypothetical protein